MENECELDLEVKVRETLASPSRCNVYCPSQCKRHTANQSWLIRERGDIFGKYIFSPSLMQKEFEASFFVII